MAKVENINITVNDNNKIKMTSSTGGVSIYYTLDGTEPSSSSTLYSEAIDYPTKKLIKAIGILEGSDNSDVTDYLCYKLLTLDKINEPNKTYRITDDYDLGGRTISIPEGCTLDFLGGSFNNGTYIYNRPTNVNIGFQYFDTTLNKPIWWNGTKWVDYNGNDADAKTSGTTAQRPSDVITGFQYFDTDINSPVYWNGTEWIKPATDTGIKVVKITLTEYDSLEPKDPNTLYAIISDSTIQ